MEAVISLIYKCSKCLYLFERIGEVDRCPDCGSVNFTEAGPNDLQEYAALRREFDAVREKKAEEARQP